MQGTIDQILAVKVTEQIFEVDNLRPGRTWVSELTGREQIDYEQLYTELPVETKDEYDSKRKYFLGLSGLND